MPPTVLLAGLAWTDLSTGRSRVRQDADDIAKVLKRLLGMIASRSCTGVACDRGTIAMPDIDTVAKYASSLIRSSLP